MAPVFWTAGVRYFTRPPSSCGDISALDCAIHGMPASIAGPELLMPGSSARANAFVGPNDASSAESEVSVRCRNGGSTRDRLRELGLAGGERGHRRVERA